MSTETIRLIRDGSGEMKGEMALSGEVDSEQKFILSGEQRKVHSIW